MTQFLKLYRPILSTRISQQWGENRACVKGDGSIIGTRTTCPKGSWPFYPTIGLTGHNGIDFPAFIGEKVFHAGTYDGWMRTEVDPSGGIGVDVVSNERLKLKDGREEYIKCRYWHLKAPIGHDKKQVKLGDTIGLAGNTGASSAPHLHFGVKVCDINGVSLEEGNGYYGAMDPNPYMTFATDALSAREFFFQEKPALSKKEQEEMLSQLSLAKQLLLALQDIIRKV